jgi:hypothetical protein
MAPRFDGATDPGQPHPRHQQVKDAKDDGEPDQLRDESRYVELRHQASAVTVTPAEAGVQGHL